jgi:hypothetical protein
LAPLYADGNRASRLAEGKIECRRPDRCRFGQRIDYVHWRSLAFVAVFFIFSIIIGMVWNRDWWKYAALFWSVFTIFYTTFFTNAAGFFTGIIGSLGYWLVQQGVERGSQPEYYYVLVQIPIYEYLPAIGTLVAIGLGLRKLLGERAPVSDDAPAPDEDAMMAGEVVEAEPVEAAVVLEVEPATSNFGAFFGLTLWWAVSSILAFTIAGERMPWLTYHMTWPMILLAGWAIGQIIDSVAPRSTFEQPQRAGLAILTLIVFVLAAFNTLRSLYGATPPFQGSELLQLQATASFIFPFITMILSGALLAYLMRDDLISLGVVALMILALITLGASLINGATLRTLTHAGHRSGKPFFELVEIWLGTAGLDWKHHRNYLPLAAATHKLVCQPGCVDDLRSPLRSDCANVISGRLY